MDSPDDGKHVEKHESDIGNYPLVFNIAIDNGHL